jgi:hypothetical protein
MPLPKNLKGLKAAQKTTETSGRKTSFLLAHN